MICEVLFSKQIFSGLRIRIAFPLPGLLHHYCGGLTFSSPRFPFYFIFFLRFTSQPGDYTNASDCFGKFDPNALSSPSRSLEGAPEQEILVDTKLSRLCKVGTRSGASVFGQL